MAFVAYMTITGAVQKDLHPTASTNKSIGQVSTGNADYADKITVLGFSSSIVIPRDMVTGVSTSSQVLEPVTFSKYFDKASPLLWQALATNELLTEIACEFWRPNYEGKGAPEKFFTIKWTTCTLIGGKAYTPLIIDPANGFFQYMDEWSFTYKAVAYDHLISSTSGSVDPSKSA